MTITNGRYFETAQVTCNNANNCNINLTTIPAGKIVIIRNLSCNWSFTAGTVVAKSAFFAIMASPSTAIASDNFSLPSADATAKVLSSRPVVHEQFGALVPPGHFPRVGVNFNSTATVILLFCSIMGTIQ